MREQVQFGSYPVLGKLGEGVMTRVYRARDRARARDVAIKLFVFEGDGALGERVKRKLFLAEASLAGRLRHPGIVAVLDAAAWSDHAYVVMEYVEGTTLEAHAAVGSLLPPLRVLEIAARCANALDYAARQGIIHRDIKPGNLLLSRAGEVKVGDFGASLQQHPGRGWVTTQVTAIGSPAYMSPEQVRMEPLTHQTDVYSLGATLYRLLAGRAPFTAASQTALAYAILNANPRPPSAHRPGLPPAVDALVLKALEKDPRERHLTWQDFIDDLALATRALSRCPLSLASSGV